MSADIELCKTHKFTIKMKDGRKLCSECLISDAMAEQHKKVEVKS